MTEVNSESEGSEEIQARQDGETAHSLSPEDLKILKLFSPLYADLAGEDSFPRKRPLLAHYTSIEKLECIFRNNEVWFSNPLLMNDWEEVRFGLVHGANLFISSQEIRSACRSQARFDGLVRAFNFFYDNFSTIHLHDTYVFCLSEHSEEDNDGLLSMWRGYGANGAGGAIVFDTAKIVYREESPLLISNVHYETKERINWLEQRVREFAEILGKSDLPNDKLHLAAYYLFERFVLFALFTKHRGFHEEKEWRVVYLRERDPQKVFDPMISYWVGPSGMEPKLKLKVNPVPGMPETDIKLSEVVERIVLGPTASHPLAISAIYKMLDETGKSDLKNRVVISGIPFRSR
jgi:hypothetical protein